MKKIVGRHFSSSSFWLLPLASICSRQVPFKKHNHETQPTPTVTKNGMFGLFGFLLDTNFDFLLGGLIILVNELLNSANKQVDENICNQILSSPDFQ